MKARVVAEAAAVAAGVALVVWAAIAAIGWFERHAAPYYCVEGSGHGWQVVRALAAIFGAMLVFWARPRLGRAVGRLPARELAFLAAGCALALGAALVVGELALRR